MESSLKHGDYCGQSKLVNGINHHCSLLREHKGEHRCDCYLCAVEFLKSWENPAWSAASTIDTALCLYGRKTLTERFFQQPKDPIPTMKEFVGQFLNSRLVIVDAGSGRTIFEGCIMELALERLRCCSSAELASFEEQG